MKISVTLDGWRPYYPFVQSVLGARANRSVLLAALAAALLSGCGGGGGKSKPSAKAPTITSQPQSLHAAIGGSATFAVGAEGTGTLTYQWFLNGNAIAGATNPTLTIDPVAQGDFGVYTVTVTNAKGTRTSDPANLTLEGAPEITTQPISVEAILGSSASFTVEATGDDPLTYQWFKNGTAIPGATADTYVVNPVVPASEAVYHVVVTNAKGSATSINAFLTIVTQTSPRITTQPASQTVALGTAASFTVTATGTPSPTFQWYKNGIAIAGATGATLTIPTVALTDEGTYYVVASNSVGATSSDNAVLTVAVPPAITTQPQSKSVNPGARVEFTVAATGSAPLSYQWFKDNVAIPGATDASYVVAAATVSDAGTYRVNVTNVAGSVSSANATLEVATPPVITQQPIIVVNAQGTSVRVIGLGLGPAGLPVVPQRHGGPRRDGGDLRPRHGHQRQPGRVQRGRLERGGQRDERIGERAVKGVGS